MLEQSMDARLFHRSTKKITSMQAGELFLSSIGGNLDAPQIAINSIATDQNKPVGDSCIWY
jgi:DNA-binding transcriptional LysR family regulator